MGKRLAHGSLNFKHPLLDIAFLIALVHIDHFVEFYCFTLSRNHVGDFFLGREFDLLNTLETLVHMGLNGARVLGLGEEHEQILVGQEVEAGEDETLLLEVIVEALLNAVQLLVGL